MTSLIRYNPWSLIRDVQNEMNTLFDRSLIEQGERQWKPRVNIRENNDKFIVAVDIPGVDPKEIKVSLDNNVLTIQGERKLEQRKEEEGYLHVERFAGTFERHLTLPDNVESKGIQAKSKHGVLEITIPKKEYRIAEKLTIKVED